MYKKPFFSIIIPTYNRGYIINQAIESVLNQSFKNWELIIVDDGSTDNTQEIVEQYLKKVNGDKIFYFKFNQNKGVNVARNFGISKAKGKYILPLDSDNQFLENSFQLIFNVLNRKEYPLSFFQIRTFSGKEISKPIEGFVNSKDYICEVYKGEYFPVVQRDIILRFPFEESINGGESIAWKRIVKQLGGVYFYSYKVLLYNDLLEDRLSIKRKNFKRLANVFKKDLLIFGNDYLKLCPKLFFEKLMKLLIYSSLSLFS